jgi:fatty-acyl-CoA synthase
MHGFQSRTLSLFDGGEGLPGSALLFGSGGTGRSANKGIAMGASPNLLKQPRSVVISATADPALLDRPLRSIADVEAIERTPLDERLNIVDFSRRISIALAARNPDDDAIIYVPDGDVDRAAQRVAFLELRRRIDRTAALLRAHGIGRTDVVAVLLPAVPQSFWSILGAMRAGIVFPVNWMLEPSYLLRLLSKAQVKAVIALGPTPGFRIWESLMSIDGQLPAHLPMWSVPGPGGAPLDACDLDAAAAAPAQREMFFEPSRGDDIGAYVHSGGTSGFPKIVKLSHRNMSYRHWTLQLASRLEMGEIIVHDSPMFHVGGLVGRCLPPLASGASILITSALGARDKRYIANYWKFVEKYRVTRLSGVPTTLAVLAKSRPRHIDLSSLKPYFITGSTALPVSVRNAFEQVSGVRVLNSYGMTENTASIAIDPRDGARKDGSSGIRLPYTRIRAVALNAQGPVASLCGPHEIGMFQIEGPGVATGYVQHEHARTARTDDGWLITGDLGRIDEDGYVFVTGRAKDIIIRGGHNIDPALIEEPLLQSADVLHAAAVGKPDSYAGELPVAYVQLVPGSQATPGELMAFLSARVAEKAAMPKEILIVDRLPLSDIGKPMKPALRRDLAERTFRAVLAESTGLSEDRLQIAVEQDAQRGTVVAIEARGVGPSAQAELEARIARTMDGYAFAYRVAWT